MGNMPSRRYLESAVRKDLSRKMVFVGGPRQVGKTTFALGILGSNASTEHPAYLNWDDPAVREPFMHGRIPVNQPLLLLDEIHKYARWRNLVKGLFDTHRTRLSILVTGSARLDYYACARTDRSLQPICSSERSRLRAPRRSTRCRAAS